MAVGFDEFITYGRSRPDLLGELHRTQEIGFRPPHPVRVLWSTMSELHTTPRDRPRPPVNASALSRPAPDRRVRASARVGSLEHRLAQPARAAACDRRMEANRCSVQRLFRRYDTDGSGTIDAREALGLIADMLAERSRRLPSLAIAVASAPFICIAPSMRACMCVRVAAPQAVALAGRVSISVPCHALSCHHSSGARARDDRQCGGRRRERGQRHPCDGHRPRRPRQLPGAVG